MISLKTSQTVALVSLISLGGLTLARSGANASATTEQAQASTMTSTATTFMGDPTATNAYARLAAQAVPSVVNIFTTQKMRGNRMHGDDPARRFFEEFFGHGMGGQGGPSEDDPQMRGGDMGGQPMSLGSGFIVEVDGKDAIIMTNNHVIANSDEVRVQFTETDDQKGVEAKVLGTDPDLDVALLKVRAPSTVKAIPMGDSEKLATGEWIAAIGNPFGHGHSITHGIVSAKERALPGGFGKYLQVDAPINPGNSGGPLVNLNGEVVGINNAIDGRGAGIGFAIPINAAKGVFAQLKKGKVERGYLGVNVEELRPDLARALRVEDKVRAPVVTYVGQGTPAAKAGIQPYDLITEIDSKPTKTPDDLVTLVRNIPVGRQARVKLLRAGKELALDVRVAPRPTSVQ